MADLKKQLIEQVDGLLRKGDIRGSEYRTLVTKIELADPRFLKMALDKFGAIRKSIEEEEDEEAVKKADATAPMVTGTSGVASAAGAAAPAPAATPAPAPATAKPAVTRANGFANATIDS